MYPSNLQTICGAAPLRRADLLAAAKRHRAAGERAVQALPSLRDRLRAGVRVVTTRRVVAVA
jgi:hypothetical protein